MYNSHVFISVFHNALTNFHACKYLLSENHGAILPTEGHKEGKETGNIMASSSSLLSSPSLVAFYSDSHRAVRTLHLQVFKFHFANISPIDSLSASGTSATVHIKQKYFADFPSDHSLAS